MEFFTLDFWKGMWDDFTEFLTDLPITILKGFLDAVLEVLGELTPPDFMATSISDQLGPVMEFIGFFLVQAGVSQACAILLSAVMFRLARKAITLGKW